MWQHNIHACNGWMIAACVVGDVSGGDDVDRSLERG
jgi:hypothetical protein